ncbi:undecaprenyl-phosphate glucose phosphotransferase [Fusibacter paucivorans]|uniref:Undecaprenyl-phosphate glucose phosphotransferase n=1 Tax=Fusibacter paucivorans TaxID=76009 RepID=A0ABS5PN50_9FIRM|nr:undecaprenyl-phosphate glucose phosphotransferase [Fusibacter paucivorans]MBS7526600.1 undecaprenyl-phosphate glucose phosphotransferase [Fusibacter paucivorans]
MIKNNQKYLNALQYILDIFSVVIALILAYFLRFNVLLQDDSVQHLSFYNYIEYLVVLVPVYLASFLLHGLYKPQRRDRFYREIIGITRSIIISTVSVLALLFINKEIHYSRSVLLIFTIFVFGLMVIQRGAIRYSLRWLRKKGYNQKHIIIVGTGELGLNFTEKIKANPQLGYTIVGYLDDIDNAPEHLGYPLLGKVDQLSEILTAFQIDELIIALPIEAYNKVARLINTCEYNGVKAQIIPAYQSILPAKPYFDNLEEIPLINIRHIPLDEPLNALVKRTFDVVVSLLVIAIFSPLFIAIAIGVKLSSPGPVIFKQERIGINRKAFQMYKFRSMRVQSDEEEKDKWTTKNDPRKTLFGNFIRKTSLDELPQFINVLKGEMSIIGPRPERPFFVEQFKDKIPKYMVKHHVRPGLTGWAQVNGWRGDTSIEKRIEHDIYYIENWTFGMDISIFLRTFWCGFINRNAY